MSDSTIDNCDHSEDPSDESQNTDGPTVDVHKMAQMTSFAGLFGGTAWLVAGPAGGLYQLVSGTSEEASSWFDADMPWQQAGVMLAAVVAYLMLGMMWAAHRVFGPEMLAANQSPKRVAICRGGMILSAAAGWAGLIVLDLNGVDGLPRFIPLLVCFVALVAIVIKLSPPRGMQPTIAEMHRAQFALLKGFFRAK